MLTFEVLPFRFFKEKHMHGDNDMSKDVCIWVAHVRRFIQCDDDMTRGACNASLHGFYQNILKS